MTLALILICLFVAGGLQTTLSLWVAAHIGQHFAERSQKWRNREDRYFLYLAALFGGMCSVATVGTFISLLQ